MKILVMLMFTFKCTVFSEPISVIQSEKLEVFRQLVKFRSVLYHQIGENRKIKNFKFEQVNTFIRRHSVSAPERPPGRRYNHF
jgi:hypothetical protein